jgi:hypothetical protein
MNNTFYFISKFKPIVMKYLKTIPLIIIGVIALYFVIDRAIPYLTNFNIKQFGNYYWPNKWWLVGHLSGGITAIHRAISI